MKIIKMGYVNYGYGSGTEIWFENPKEVWVIFREFKHSFKWRFCYKEGHMIIETPGIKATRNIFLNPEACFHLTGKRISKDIFVGRKVKV